MFFKVLLKFSNNTSHCQEILFYWNMIETITFWINWIECQTQNPIFIKTFLASKCERPPIPEGGSFQLFEGQEGLEGLEGLEGQESQDNSTIRVRFSCVDGLYLLGDDVIGCDASGSDGSSGSDGTFGSGSWIGQLPVCASDVARNKPASQSSLTGLANKPVDPKNLQVTKHQGEKVIFKSSNLSR